MSLVQGLETLSADFGDGIEFTLVAGERALYVDGDLQAARRWFDDAYRMAQGEDNSIAMARAALGLGGVWVHEHRTTVDAGLVRMRQRHALSGIDPRSTLALRLRARLTGEEDYRNGEHAAIIKVVAEARRAGDAQALAEALSLAHHCLLAPEHGMLRADLAEELVAHAGSTGRRGDLLMGLLWQTVDRFLAADPHAERALEELRGRLDLHDHRAVGFVVSAIDVMLAIRTGRFGHAETLANVAAERGATAGDVDTTGWYGGQLGTIRWYQGRIAELVPVLMEMVNSPMLSAVDNSYFAALAVAAASNGDKRLAAGMVARLRGRDLGDLPRSSSWLTTMYGIVEAAHLLDDAETAAQAYHLLTPFARLPMIVSLGVSCFGSTRHTLGMASLTVGDVDRAVEHLRGAVQDNLALGHWPAAVLSRWRLGQALARRGGPNDEAANRELAQAQEEADELGMLLPAAPEARTPVKSKDAGKCRRHGRHWLIELSGRSVLVDHSVGMRHLATLISNPGSEIRATDLAAGPGMTEGETDTGQPLLDEQAKRTYKQRLAQLQAEIDELESQHDLGRTEALRAERDWLVDELAAATGMSGRVRRFTGSEERARIAVGKAIRRALARITEADPIIGEELRTTVQTGLRCCYRPSDR
ncbi:hypothetical protein [Acrocarpospora phusangensis]|uniref:hypothetical protein n=1 Tax=Acrocarpospora phusangensis TaxID=1070424 RepID=UPI001EF36A72|nr:hypothetical protein [Acrocarpospora phusangensis]